jgi:hypothetical protein
MEQLNVSHRSGLELIPSRPLAASNSLPESLIDWPAVAVDFAICSQRRILAEGRAIGNEAAIMALRRARVWWKVTTLREQHTARPDDVSSRAEMERAFVTLGGHKARLERSERGMRVAIEGQDVGPDVQNALRTLGIDHLERIVLAERRFS